MSFGWFWMKEKNILFGLITKIVSNFERTIYYHCHKLAYSNFPEQQSFQKIIHICFVFKPAFGCCLHLKTGQNTRTSYKQDKVF